jgi:glycine betaine/choline ABC-type transport system substrate-binding protein
MEKTLRDELAMSLDAKFFPTLENEAAIKLFSEHYGLEYDFNDPIKMLDFGLKYQAIIRYQYADAMLLYRE